MKENETVKEEFSYDVVAYPSQIIPQTHPDRLAAVAKLYGMNPVPAENCRVLELGCGTGTNLNWLAANLPKSEFVGVDLAQIHISEAQENVAELGLQNVSFFQQDVLEITEKSVGKFDYIIAHGLFSWVPQMVREKVLSLYEELLNPNGVGFISYNVYPGCYRRQIVMDMMKFHTKRVESYIEKVKKGVSFVEVLTNQTTQSTAYHQILNYELENLAKYPVQNIYHDELSDINQPFYFTEFIAEAEKNNLQFISESEYFTKLRNRKKMSEEVAQTFENISRNRIELEQFSDFLDCRRFRQTLLCKKDVTLETEINPLKLKELYISSFLKPTSPTIDLNPDSFKEFLSKVNAKVEIGHVLTKLVLTYLVNLAWHPVKFADLIERANSTLLAQGFIYENIEKETEITATILLQLYSPNAVGFHAAKSNALDYVSEKPMVSKFALWQSAKEDFAVNFYGGGLNADDNFVQLLLSLLDGTRTREDLITELTKNVRANEEIVDKEAFLNTMPENLDRDLFVLAKMGFLIG